MNEHAVRYERCSAQLDVAASELLAQTSERGRVGLGSFLAALGRRLALTEEEAAVFEALRDKGAYVPVDFG